MLALNPPAKINWLLHVLGRRSDGYHDILSLMQCITLNDSLTIEDADDIEIVTDAKIPKEDNLVYRAAVLMKEQKGIESGARITLKKEIPSAAGLGGGSSDAASTLMGLNELWNLGLEKKELAEIGARIGSDVPFFLFGPSAVIRGKGDIVSPVGLGRSYPMVLVKPPVEVSSAWAYGRLVKARDRSGRGEVLTKGGDNIKLFCQALENGDFSLVSSLQKNDLEPLVAERYPVISEIKLGLMQKGAVFSSMSGSGPAVFGIFRTEEEAVKAAEDLSYHWCRVVKTITECKV